MDVIETLIAEHRVIERVLDALEAFASRIDRGGLVDPEDVQRFAEFFRGFADSCHHGKEEDILFAAMEEAGFARNGGPLGVMRDEHNRGRRLVRRMRRLGERRADWTDRDREEFAGTAQAFARLLREHIRKEDQVLYPMARERLSPEALGRVVEMFEMFERRRSEAGEIARFHKLAERLVGTYLGIWTPQEHLGTVEPSLRA